MTLTPAHGRDYKSKKAVLEDWHAGKDFIIDDFLSRWDGKPANKTSLLHHDGPINLRFDKLRKKVVVDF